MKRLWILILVLALWSTTSHIVRGAEPSQTSPEYREEALALFARMTPSERIGQLFFVSFDGSQVADTGAVYTLITENHLGGVVLLDKNDNFTDQGTTLEDVRLLTSTLQELSLTGESPNVITSTVPADLPPTDPLAESEAAAKPDPIGIPLLIGTYHGGNGHSELHTGVTELPSYLALGATWSTDQVEAVGEVAGMEMAGLGFNLLLGPALDVLNNPSMIASNQAGTNSFGGSAFWVGRLGTAYVRGVQQGSDGRLAVVATGFPGSGASDRPLTEEIATVRKSFDQLLASELVPYIEVTGGEGPVDGLMTAHIRYQGFQGNIQANTPPVSFDPQAVETLMSVPEFTTWQGRGGILVSSPLGWPAVARYYNPDGSDFPHRQVAKDALLAGNDLLLIDEFGTAPAANLQDTMAWFVERYATDLAFQTRVDEAVLKILTLKLRLYDGDFSLENIRPPTEPASDIGRSQGRIYSVAQAAITLLSPGPTELANRLPSAPSPEDQIVILTDVRTREQCSGCPVRPIIGQETLADRMVALYGPEASGQVAEDQISSFSFEDLITFLAADFPVPAPEVETTPPSEEEVEPTPTPEITPEPPEPPIEFAVQEALVNADWIIVGLQDVEPGTQSAAFNRLLAERPSLLRGKNVVVFAFELPIYLDTTEISQLTAYYGFFSSSDPFIDSAVQTVFKDLSPRGASPITIQSLGYDLASAIQPRADQLISLSLFDLENMPLTPGSEPLSLEPGDTLRLRTGVILDQNGNPVPDGTVVQFTQEDRVSGFFDVIGEVLTVEGVATFDYVLDARQGQFRLRASSGQADTSDEVDIAIADNQAASVVVITPTPQPTTEPTPTTTPTPTETPTPASTRTPTPTPEAIVEEVEPQINILLSELQMMISMVSGLIVLGFLAFWSAEDFGERLRRVLWAAAFGLGGYIYFILDLPGLGGWLPPWGNWLGMAVTAGFGIIGLAVAAGLRAAGFVEEPTA